MVSRAADMKLGPAGRLGPMGCLNLALKFGTENIFLLSGFRKKEKFCKIYQVLVPTLSICIPGSYMWYDNVAYLTIKSIFFDHESWIVQISRLYYRFNLTTELYYRITQTMSIGPFFGYGAALVGIGAIIYSNLPTRLTLGSVVPTIQYLADTKLTLLEPSKAPIASNKEIVVSLTKNILVHFCRQRIDFLGKGFIRKAVTTFDYGCQKARMCILSKGSIKNQRGCVKIEGKESESCWNCPWNIRSRRISTISEECWYILWQWGIKLNLYSKF